MRLPVANNSEDALRGRGAADNPRNRFAPRDVVVDQDVHDLPPPAARTVYGLKDLFEDWLARHFPDRKDKVLNRLRSMRGGKLYEAKFHDRMSGEGIFAEQMATMFRLACRRAGMDDQRIKLSTAAFRRHGAESLFE